MKLLLVLTFLTLVCIARSTPVPLSKARTIILPDYDNIDDENGIVDPDIGDEMNSTTTTTTTTTRRSTYLFPTRNRNTFPSRRPWLTSRTTSIRTTTINTDEIDDDIEEEDGFKYFKNIPQFFKKIWEDIKKFFRNVVGTNIMKIIQQYFNRKSDD